MSDIRPAMNVQVPDDFVVRLGQVPLLFVCSKIGSRRNTLWDSIIIVRIQHHGILFARPVNLRAVIRHLREFEVLASPPQYPYALFMTIDDDCRPVRRLQGIYFRREDTVRDIIAVEGQVLLHVFKVIYRYLILSLSEPRYTEGSMAQNYPQLKREEPQGKNVGVMMIRGQGTVA